MFTKAIEFADEKLKTNKSDGCTYAPELGISIWCQRHDMWRRFEYETPWDRDAYFFKGIVSEVVLLKPWTWFYLPVAVIYWAFVFSARKLGFFN